MSKAAKVWCDLTDSIPEDASPPKYITIVYTDPRACHYHSNPREPPAPREPARSNTIPCVGSGGVVVDAAQPHPPFAPAHAGARCQDPPEDPSLGGLG